MINYLKKIFERVTKLNDSVLSYRSIAREVVIPSRAFVNWGIYLANAGEVDLALEKFESSSYMRPQSPETFNNWGIALATTGKYDEAIDKFKQAVKIDSKCVKSYVLWGAALVETGKVDEAEKMYEKALEFNSKNAEIYINWGIALARQNMRPLAETKFKKAVNLSPRSSQAFFLWGVVLVELERYEEAVEKLDFSIKLNSNNPDAWHYLAIAYLKIKNLQEAYEKAKMAIEMIPSKVEFQLNIAEILTEMRKYEKAIDYYKIAQKIMPDYHQLYLCWGITLQKYGEHFEAIEKLRKSLELLPEQTQTEYYLAISLAETGETDKAEEIFLSVVNKDPRYVDAYMKLGAIASIKHNIPLAIERYKQVAKYNLKKTEANYLIASGYISMGDYQRSLEFYDKSVKDSPEHLDSWIGYAIALNETGNTEEAIRKIRRAYRIAPDSAQINMIYGVILSKDDKTLKDAIEKFDNALKITPDILPAYIGKAETLIKLKKFNEAINTLNEVLFRSPNLIQAMFLLGGTFIELAEVNKEFDYLVKASEIFNKILEADPHHLDSLANLAFIKAKNGDCESFENEFRRLNSQYPDKNELIRIYLNKCIEKLGYNKSADEIL